MNKYFDMLILALVIPAIVLIIFGIMILGNQMDPGDLAYLLLLFVLFIPAGQYYFWSAGYGYCPSSLLNNSTLSKVTKTASTTHSMG